MTSAKHDLENQVRMIAKEIECGFARVDDENDESPIMDWLEGVLDFHWIVSSDKQTLRGARLLVAFGGPTIWVDTSRGVVEGYWWQDSAFETFYAETENARELHDYLEMIWSC